MLLSDTELISGLFDGDRFDLDLHAHRKFGNLVTNPGWHLFGIKTGINGIHSGKVVHVGQQDGRFDHVFIGIPCLRENCPDVFEGLFGLCFDTLGYRSVGRINGQLPRYVERTVCFDSLAVRADRFWRIIC